MNITPDSSEIEKKIRERMSKASIDCRGFSKPILHKDKWIEQHLQAFLLTVDEEIASYIVMGQDKLDPEDIVYDMFTVPERRGKGNMHFLLRNTLEYMSRRFDAVWFKEPLTETEWHFLESVSEETGLKFRTC
jgi:hypothetical protein